MVGADDAGARSCGGATGSSRRPRRRDRARRPADPVRGGGRGRVDDPPPGPPGSILHGNVVEDAGIDHLTLEWSADHALLSFDEPILAAAFLGRLRSELLAGHERRVPVVYIDPASLDLLPGDVVVARTTPDAWRLVDPQDGLERIFELDPAGILVLPGEVRWPLER